MSTDSNVTKVPLRSVTALSNVGVGGNMQIELAIGSACQHPLFGFGVIKESTSADRVTAQFTIGLKMLMRSFVTPVEHNQTTRAIVQSLEPTPRYLREVVCTESISGFIEYLRTPEANCTLSLEARNEDFDEALRAKYTELSGENLREGFGYNIAPFSAGKQGCEGGVRFTPPPTIPSEVQKMLSPNIAGFINHIGFVWLLVRAGFRVSR